MKTKLVIVESPSKSKTIEQYLGDEYIVLSSKGHIRDLAISGVGGLGLDIENNFAPKYEIIKEKKKVVKELKEALNGVLEIYLATDPDREGEAISWHLKEVLKINGRPYKRVIFNEITKSAVIKAFEDPRDIDLDLVSSQETRRILDRIIGFKLSKLLQNKIKSKSAGRVQSATLKIIVDREKEINAFIEEEFWKVKAEFNGFVADLVKFNNKNVVLKNEKETDELLDTLNKEFVVSSIETKNRNKEAKLPFTTSSLQQEASRKLGFPVGKTMRIAQKLYEAGFITYMRTDSVNLSSLALNTAKDTVIKEFGEKFYKKRVFKTKSKNAQEAHEAIRPAYIQNKSISGTSEEERLYDLIRKRTLASQMADAAFEQTKVTIKIKNSEYKFIASGEVLLFPGFLKIYSQKNEDSLLPPLNKNEILEIHFIEATEQFSKYPPRYSEAALVKQLEEKGIGRPSTYAPTISTIEKRGYMIKESRQGIEKEVLHIKYKNNKIAEKTERKIFGTEKNKLFPTDIAMVVTDFLKDNFQNIIDYNFTANVEEQFDQIANGKLIWHKMIETFYQEFHKKIEDTIEHADRNSGERILGDDPETGKQVSVRLGKYGPVVQLGIPDEKAKIKPKFASLRKDQHIENITLEEALELLKNSGKGRLLGKDPVSGKNIYVRFARYGAVAQLGDTDDKEKPKYAGLLKGMTIDTVSLEEAIELFKLPRDVGEFEGKKVVAAVGRFGPYIRHDSKFVSLKKTDDPLSITIERAEELILEKREKDKKRLIKEFKEDDTLKIIKDRWGKPCVHYNKKYIRLSANTKPEDLTFEDCMQIVEKEFVTLDKNKK
ncbi:MAG: type I DNA topoisomerase, partial [Bacteroidales bacterium]|nr:type I DNA topoisomerase [Bacteroidales bacterium]